MINVSERKSSLGHDSATRRIASNSLVLFVRIFFITIVNLVAVRFVLSALGEEDYGIYNAVASVVLTGTCFVTVFAVAIQRFYSYALGAGDVPLADIYSASTNIILGLLLVLLLVFETGGVAYLHHFMTIPAERLATAEMLFHISMVTFFFTLLQVPSTAAIFAFEDMKVYAVISVCDCLVRFMVALLIPFMGFDGLLFYGSGILVSSFLLCMTNVIVCRIRYQACFYHFHISAPGLYRRLLSFSGWTMLGTVTGTSLVQGSALLINYFFNPLVNAAFAIANYINYAVTSLTNSVVLSFRPTMVKSYAQGDYEEVGRLFYLNNKFLMTLLLAVGVPLIAEMPTLLPLWLENASHDMILFSRLMVIYIIVLSMHNPITTIIQSTGEIRNYSISVESFTLLNIPLTWLLFSYGLPAYGVFLSMISTCSVAHLVRIVCLKRSFSTFTFGRYGTQVVLPFVSIAFATLLYVWLLHHCLSESLWRAGGIIVTAPILTILLMLTFGTTADERRTVIAFVRRCAK